MILDEIRPVDVYQLVTERTGETQNLVRDLLTISIVLCVLIGLNTLSVWGQIAAKVLIWRRVIKLLRRSEEMVDAAARHGKTTDRQVERMVARVEETKKELAGIPDATAAKLQEKMITGSGTDLK